MIIVNFQLINGKPIEMKNESSLKSKIFVQIKAELIFDPQLTYC